MLINDKIFTGIQFVFRNHYMYKLKLYLDLQSIVKEGLNNSLFKLQKLNVQKCILIKYCYDTPNFR